MTNEKMERQLAAALEKTAPDDVSGVLSRCEARKGTVINMPTMKTAKRKWTILVAACLAVVLLAGGGVLYQQANAVASVVSLDVNPSIELKVNSSEKVLVCTPLNEDAKAILADMSNGADLKGAKLDVAVNAIVGSLVRNGYLDSISSAIMISVEDKDAARAEKLQRELTSTVDGVLQTSEAKAAVLTQTLTQDAAREQQARENSISTGKAALVNRVLAINPALKFDALAKLSVEELKDLAEAGAPAMPIGTDKAMDIAGAAFAKASTAKMAYSEVDPELDESLAHYEVEIKSQSGEEFEYKLDAYTGGLKAGEMFVLAARPSIGKTSLALNLIRNLVLPTRSPHPRRVAFFSLEMTAAQIARRLLCTEAGLSESVFWNKSFLDSDLTKMTNAVSAFQKAKLFIDDTGGLTIAELRAKARRLKMKEHIDCVVIDYLQLMHADGRTDSRQQEVAEISSGIKTLAKDLKIPVLVLAQLNREVDKTAGAGARPKLAHLRESGTIEQDADIVTFLHRNRDDAKEVSSADQSVDAEWIIEKNRNGRTGILKLLFFPTKMEFIAAAPYKEEDCPQ